MHYFKHSLRPLTWASRGRRGMTSIVGGLLALAVLLTGGASRAAALPPLPTDAAAVSGPSAAVASVAPGPMWTDLGDARTAKDLLPRSGKTLPLDYRLLKVDLSILATALANAPHEKDTPARDGMELTLPLPDGSFQRFRVVESPMIGPDVQAIVPEFRTYLAQGIDDPTAALRLDTSSRGFHAYGRTASGTLWIDPHADGDTEHVISAWKEDFAPSSEGFRCDVAELDTPPETFADKALATTGDLLHTYRMVMTLTGEYCTNFGGTTAATAQSLVTLNRINAIFEVDVAVRFNVVNVIAYPNAATDPFPNGGVINSTLLIQNQANTDAVYGTANYDIGHILTGPNQAGLAYYAALCGSVKAQGGTSFTVPYRDDFAVTYMGHELGHQLDARHSFNTASGQCGGARVGSAAYEPGSGSTIMSYAGGCPPEDSQAVPDPYFNIGSLENMIARREAVTCAVVTATGNTPPVADAGADWTIPRGTAFWVNGAGTDPDGNTLSYSWEQFDLGNASPPLDPYGPLYRSFSPADNGARYFPDFDQIFDGSSDPYEVMPSVDRSLTLRLTVRDNFAGGGGVDDDELELTVSGAPFAIIAPNGGETFAAGQPVTVTWDVGGSVATDVIIWMLSANGFDTLAGSTPNDGSETVNMPCGFSATDCRIWIQEITGGGVRVNVFDVSNAVFTLNDGLPDYAPYNRWADNILANSVNTPELPTSLIGDTTSYMWWALVNYGSAWPCATVEAAAYVDERLINNAALGTAPGFWNSWGPTQPYFSGGRHTLWQVIDETGVQPELDETNNSYARQWVWQPTILGAETVVQRAQPPERLAGSPHIPGGVTFFANMDGLRLTPDGSTWRAAAISSLDGSDYDIYLFDPTTGPEAGFENSLTASAGVGVTDVVLINEQVAGSNAYDTGLLRYGGGGDFVADSRTSGASLSIGASLAGVAVEQNQVIDIGAFDIGPAQTGRNVIELTNVSTSQPVDLLLFAPQNGVMNRFFAVASATVDANGRAFIDADFTETGTWSYLLVRNASQGTAPFTYDLRLRTTPPDIATAVLPGSHGPVVPRPDTSIPVGDPVPAPTLLPGDVGSIFSFHVANNGPADANLWDLASLIDGVVGAGIEWPFGLPGGTTAISSQSIGPVFVSGGRHTAGLFFDSANEFDELYEDNNRHAEQWVWEPAQLALETTAIRATPPDPVGGWDDIPTGLTREPNVDGLRTPGFASSGDSGYWGGFAAVPAAGGDIDLRVHAASTGAQDGFDVLLETSALGGDLTEIVLFDLDGTLPANVPYDIGVQRAALTGYTAHATESVFLTDASPLGATFGTFVVPGGEIMDLFEFGTFDGTGQDVPLEIRVDNLAGGADLVLGVFTRSDGSGFYNVLETLPGGLADTGGAGADENLSLVLPGDAYFAIAVYKASGSEVGKAADYQLSFIDPSVSPVTDTPRLIAGIENFPNPFNPQTSLQFTLARAGRATVRIYDVHGKLVRTLIDGELPAGRHTRIWSGSDESDRQVASGVYMARYTHPDGVEIQRMVLVK